VLVHTLSTPRADGRRQARHVAVREMWHAQLERVGHLPHLERPDAVAGLIEDWVGVRVS